MKKLFTCFSFTIVFCMCGAGVFAQTGAPLQYENGSPDDEVLKNDKSAFPFIADHIDAQYDLYLDLTDSAITRRYAPIFKRHKMAFTGDTWDEVIRQLMEERNANMSKLMVTMPGDDGLYIKTGSKNKEAFLKELLPILNNRSKFEDFLTHLDKSKLPE